MVKKEEAKAERRMADIEAQTDASITKAKAAAEAARAEAEAVKKAVNHAKGKAALEKQKAEDAARLRQRMEQAERSEQKFDAIKRRDQQTQEAEEEQTASPQPEKGEAAPAEAQRLYPRTPAEQERAALERDLKRRELEFSEKAEANGAETASQAADEAAYDEQEQEHQFLGSDADLPAGLAARILAARQVES